MASLPRDHDEHRRHPSTISQKVLNHRRTRRRTKRNDRRFLDWNVSYLMNDDDDDEEATAA